MSHNNLIITPQTKVGELLDAYPELEKVLFELSPAFAKLKNPILRKTVARIATLQQASVVGKLDIGELVNRLRNEVGQAGLSGLETAGDPFQSAPAWFDEKKITIRFDAVPLINVGNSPMAEILNHASQLKEDEIFELQAPFIPAPIIEKLKERGFQSYSVQLNDKVLNYFHKSKS
jgi:hypothetical protein